MSTELLVIVVDDNERLRNEFVCNLSKPGWSVEEVASDRCIDTCLALRSPYVVLINDYLPHQVNSRLAIHLKREHQDVGIILLSPSDKPTDRTASYRAGVDVYLAKPTNWVEICSVIENLNRRLVQSNHF